MPRLDRTCIDLTAFFDNWPEMKFVPSVVGEVLVDMVELFLQNGVSLDVLGEVLQNEEGHMSIAGSVYCRLHNNASWGRE